MKEKMQTNTIYEEKILLKGLTGILTIITASLLCVLVDQIFIEPIGTRPVPNWSLLLMFLLFSGLTINFSRLCILMTPLSINVSYGILKKKIRWEEVGDCYLDDTSIISYGGWGIRIATKRQRHV